MKKRMKKVTEIQEQRNVERKNTRKRGHQIGRKEEQERKEGKDIENEETTEVEQGEMKHEEE